MNDNIGTMNIKDDILYFKGTEDMLYFKNIINIRISWLFNGLNLGYVTGRERAFSPGW
jgi:hypothetical protein